MKVMNKEQMVVVDLIQIASDQDKQIELNVEIKTKRCNNCDQFKEYDRFYKNGYYKTCKECRCIARSQRYKKAKSSNKDKANTDPCANNLHNPRKFKPINRPSLLSSEDIHKIAEVLILLEGWALESDTQ